MCLKQIVTQCLWRLAHVALTVAVALRSCAAWLMHKLSLTKETVVCDARPLAALPQRPQAIAFLLDRDTAMYSRPEHTVRRAATLALYAAASGVPYITLYDPHGVVRASPELLCTLLASEARRLRLYSSSGHTADDECVLIVDTPPSSETGGNDSTERRVSFRFATPPPSSSSSSPLQSSDSGVFHVRLCCAEDGRQDIVGIAHRAAVAAQRGEDVALDEESISRSLRGLQSLFSVHFTFPHSRGCFCCFPASFGFPDPDMAVVFGWSTVMSGFQPWQTRLTEFLFVLISSQNFHPLHHHLHIHGMMKNNSFVGDVRYFGWTDFAATYEKYSHRNKRFGK